MAASSRSDGHQTVPDDHISQTRAALQKLTNHANRESSPLSRARTIAVDDSSSRSVSPSSRDVSRLRNRDQRDSFSSVKEDPSGIAQSFLDSKAAKRTLNGVSEEHKTDKTAIHLPSQTHDFCSPCGSFRGWKQIRLGGKRLSKSSNDLRGYSNFGREKGWVWETDQPQDHPPTTEVVPQESRTRRSTIEQLPQEILDQIVGYLAIEVPPSGYAPRNIDLVSCLLACRTLHASTLGVLYKNITIPHSNIFTKFLDHIKRYPSLGTIVRRLDFSHFTSIGLGRTRQMNSEIQNLTSYTLLECLELLPNLREFLATEHIDDDLKGVVLQKLLYGIPTIQALDFSGCSSSIFNDAFMDTFTQIAPSAEVLNLRRISLHDCTTLSARAFRQLLPRLPNLTHLDVGHTQITDKALASIPPSARLTHLNLGRCTHITGEGVVDFLKSHPAVKETLVYLNLMADPARYRLLEQGDLDILLPSLPTTLRSLNLGGARITKTHVKSLVPLAKHLEELSIAYSDLTILDINSLFIPSSSNWNSDEITEEELDWVPSTLHYLDLTGVPSVTESSLFSSSCILIGPHSAPLEVIELGSRIISLLKERAKSNQQRGWVVRELGRRGWYVRVPSQNGQPSDDGRREWKMGARWWGMRKVPVAYGEVGGLYGHYMFKQ